MSHQVTITQAKISLKDMKPVVEFSGIIDIAASNRITDDSDEFFRNIGEEFFEQIKEKIIDTLSYKV